MHIVDHTKFHKSPRKRSFKPMAILALLCAVMIAGGVVLTLKQTKGANTPAKTAMPILTAVTTPVPSPSPSIKPTKLKLFTGMEFRRLYETYAYPNTREVTTYPEITGNAKADEKIRNLAVTRGYMQRSVPVSTLTKIEDGFLLQQRAATSWQILKTAAQKDGLVLGLTAAFRSPEDQRSLFMERFRAAGLTPEQVAAGSADQQVTDLLKITAIPGFSRHHTGYTVDISCESNKGVIFENTTCFRWLSQNNYQHAKESGWIPSYPPGAGDQGPNPEAWEYVWVGTAALYE